jgi:UPF0755 protein
MALISIYFFALYLLSQPLKFSKASVIIQISKNQSLASVIDTLSSQKIISYPSLFFWYVKLNNLSTHLQAGEYKISSKQSTIDVIEQFTKGNIYYRAITFIEGWSFRQVREALDQNPYVRHDIANYSDAKVKLLLKDSYKSLEGLFYPDTYYFARGTSDLFILKESRKTMKNTMGMQWKKRQKNLPYKSAYQSLIAASLIEKETAFHAEKPLIAGVIVARLKKGMKLQIDPTVIYALGEKFDGQLSRKDLKINSRYNTYRYYGLPPTPIALPGKASIMAALHPKRTKYLFYRSRGNGSHVFSRTYHEHKRAVPSNTRKNGAKSNTGKKRAKSK